MPPLGVLPTSGRRGAQAPSCEASPPRAGCWPVQSLAAGPTPYLYIRIALQFSSLCHLLSFCIPSKSHSLAAFVSRMCRLMYGVVRSFGLARVGEFVQVSVFGFLGLRSLPPRPSRPPGAASSSACPPACLLPACPPACSPPPRRRGPCVNSCYGHKGCFSCNSLCLACSCYVFYCALLLRFEWSYSPLLQLVIRSVGGGREPPISTCLTLLTAAVV